MIAFIIFNLAPLVLLVAVRFFYCLLLFLLLLSLSLLFPFSVVFLCSSLCEVLLVSVSCCVFSLFTHPVLLRWCLFSKWLWAHDILAKKDAIKTNTRSNKSESARFQNVTPSANSDQSESALFSKCHPQCQLRPVKFHPQRFKMSPSVPTPTRPSRHCFQNFTPCANSSQSELVLEVKF